MNALTWYGRRSSLDLSSYIELSIRLATCLSITIGRRLARAYASFTRGEFPSVRMTLPIDMKNLPMQAESAMRGNRR